MVEFIALLQHTIDKFTQKNSISVSADAFSKNKKRNNENQFAFFFSKLKSFEF